MSDLIDRQALLRQIDIDSDGEPGYYGDTWKFIDTIKRMPSALGTNLAEVGTDCISREQAINALRKLCEEDIEDYGCEIPEGFNQDHLDRATFAIKQLPPIQPVNCSEFPNNSDAISRQTAIDALKDATFDFEACKTVLEQLPPAQPKTGRWLYCEDTTADCVDGYRCDQCGLFVPWDYQHKSIDYIKDYNFCPHCGADMRTKETDCDYERAVDQLEHDMLYEPTFNQDDGSM